MGYNLQFTISSHAHTSKYYTNTHAHTHTERVLFVSFRLGARWRVPLSILNIKTIKTIKLARFSVTCALPVSWTNWSSRELATKRDGKNEQRERVVVFARAVKNRNGNKNKHALTHTQSEIQSHALSLFHCALSLISNIQWAAS